MPWLDFDLSLHFSFLAYQNIFCAMYSIESRSCFFFVFVSSVCVVFGPLTVTVAVNWLNSWVRRWLNGRVRSSRFVSCVSLYMWLSDSSTGPVYWSTRCLVHSFAFVPVLARCSDKKKNEYYTKFCHFEETIKDLILIKL